MTARPHRMCPRPVLSEANRNGLSLLLVLRWGLRERVDLKASKQNPAPQAGSPPRPLRGAPLPRSKPQSQDPSPRSLRLIHGSDAGLRPLGLRRFRSRGRRTRRGRWSAGLSLTRGRARPRARPHVVSGRAPSTGGGAVAGPGSRAAGPGRASGAVRGQVLPPLRPPWLHQGKYGSAAWKEAFSGERALGHPVTCGLFPPKNSQTGDFARVPDSCGCTQ